MTPAQRAKYGYPAGSIKRDPETLAVAVRTTAAASSDHAWSVAVVDRRWPLLP